MLNAVWYDTREPGSSQGRLARVFTAADERDDTAADRRACRDLQTQRGCEDDSQRETSNFKVFRIKKRTGGSVHK